MYSWKVCQAFHQSKNKKLSQILNNGPLTINNVYCALNIVKVYCIAWQKQMLAECHY